MRGELGRLELIRESSVAVVNETRANVIHSSYSSIICEGHEFSCALLAADGRLAARGVDDNPIRNFAVPYSMAEALLAAVEELIARAARAEVSGDRRRCYPIGRPGHMFGVVW